MLAGKNGRDYRRNYDGGVRCCVRLFRFLGRKSDLSEEIESHLQMAVADRIARGESPADAGRGHCENSAMFP